MVLKMGRGVKRTLLEKNKIGIKLPLLNIKQAYNVLSSPGRYKHLRFINRGLHKYLKKLEARSKLLGPERCHEAGFHTEKPQILGTSIQRYVTTVIRHKGFVHPCINIF
jgi:hypothetical protein